MKRSILFLAGLAVADAASADWVMVQRIEGMETGAPAEMTLKIKDTKFRMDMPGGVSTIIDQTSGDAATLMHGQKMVMKIKGGDFEAIAKQLRQNAPAPAARPTLQPTGRKEKINGFDTAEYTCKMGDGSHASFWVAKDYPNYKPLLAAFLKLQESGPLRVGKDYGPTAEEFPGMPVRTVVDSAGKKITTTLVSAKEQAVDAKEFAVPADYKEMPVPQFGAPGTPGAPGGKAQ